MNKRFENYRPSTALRQAIALYREARATREGQEASGRAQEVNTARDAPGTGAAEGEATRQTDDREKD